MGSDSAKTHEAFSVAPSPLDEDDWDHDEDAAEESPDTSTPEGKLAHTATLIAGLADHTDSDHLYEDLCWLVAVAHQELGDAGLAPADHQAWQAKVAAAAAEALQSLPDEKLRQLATEAGFAHPLLVSAGALAHWLNPAYPADAPSKVKIQAKAAERYGQLASGELQSVHGHTFADVQDSQPQLDEPGWVATPAQVALALADVSQRLADLDPDGDHGGGLGALLAAERHLRTAACPGIAPADLDAAKAAASALIDKQLGALPSTKRDAMVAAAVTDALAAGALDEPQARWLDRGSQLALLRASTADSVRAHLEALAAQRADQVAAIEGATAACSASGDGAPADAGAIAAWATACGQLQEARTAVSAWAGAAADRPALAALGATSSWALAQEAKQRTTAWRAWAKQQPLAALRAAAADLGLKSAVAACRAEAQNFIAARWDPVLDGHAIQQQVSGQPAKHVAPATAATGPGTASPVTPTSAAAGGWRAKHAAAVAALKAHQALVADIPAPQPASEIASLALSQGAPAAVGGMHPKTLHTDEHGRSWLHKPDKTGGARAHAEAAAARLHHLAGIRTPPVYVRDVGGKTGTLQPWVAGGEQLPADPSKWTQAELDSLVRFHVASWMCSNHDGNPSNILRTPTGGLAPIDHGQAWRYFGEDRLSIDYDPNAAYGNPPPAYLTAYKAAAGGKLSKHVRVRPAAALPAIKAFEQIPDAQLRAELEPVAVAGVEAGLPWAARMRKAAAKRLGTTAVNDADVADEFCRQVIARKQRLRDDFAQLFAGLGLGSGGLTKVA